MRNTLIDKLNLNYTGVRCSPPWSSKEVCVKEATRPNMTIIKDRYIYELNVKLGVSIPMYNDEADQRVVERAKKYLARTVYGEYEAKLQEWLYSSEAMYLLPPEELEMFNNILKSMRGDVL